MAVRCLVAYQGQPMAKSQARRYKKKKVTGGRLLVYLQENKCQLREATKLFLEETELTKVHIRF